METIVKSVHTISRIKDASRYFDRGLDMCLTIREVGDADWAKVINCG